MTFLHPFGQYPTIVRLMKGAFTKDHLNLNIQLRGMCLLLPGTFPQSLSDPQITILKAGDTASAIKTIKIS